ncbi:2-dehydro-3-deoxygalactonokinase [Marivita sp. S2033]|uniref:2-dehydro-3-deoxygalactonokinase n=1 Tax=Marivita sp. S2033 TaxID=3373187 RepID=UPI003982A2B1
MKAAIYWIAVACGAAQYRLWAMSRDGTVLFQQDYDTPPEAMTLEAFETLLLDVLGATVTSPVPVIACGLSASRHEWAEAAYVAVPCAPPISEMATRVHTNAPQLALYSVSGVKQANPADVMHGEETAIGGFLSLNSKFDGVICIAGRHSRWVHISAGEIVSFRSFMTQELLSLLSEQSELRHSIAKSGFDEAVFLDTVAAALSQPKDFAARLLSLQAEALLDDLDPIHARSRLSGLLIGVELAAAKPYWLGQHVALIGDDALCQLHAVALGAQGLPVERTDGARMTLEGLKAAYAQLESVS